VHLPAPLEPAEDVNDVLACGVVRPGVSGQECLGDKQVRRQGLSREPLATKSEKLTLWLPLIDVSPPPSP